MSVLSVAERNPVAVRAAVVAAVTAVVHVLVLAGWVSTDLEASIAGAVDALGVVVLVVWARAGVTPNAKVIARVTTEGQVVTGDAAVLETGQVLDTSGSAVAPALAVKPDLIAA